MRKIPKLILALALPAALLTGLGLAAGSAEAAPAAPTTQYFASSLGDGYMYVNASDGDHMWTSHSGKTQLTIDLNTPPGPGSPPTSTLKDPSGNCYGPINDSGKWYLQIVGCTVARAQFNVAITGGSVYQISSAYLANSVQLCPRFGYEVVFITAEGSGSRVQFTCDTGTDTDFTISTSASLTAYAVPAGQVSWNYQSQAGHGDLWDNVNAQFESSHSHNTTLLAINCRTDGFCQEQVPNGECMQLIHSNNNIIQKNCDTSIASQWWYWYPGGAGYGGGQWWINGYANKFPCPDGTDPLLNAPSSGTDVNMACLESNDYDQYWQQIP